MAQENSPEEESPEKRFKDIRSGIVASAPMAVWDAMLQMSGVTASTEAIVVGFAICFLVSAWIIWSWPTQARWRAIAMCVLGAFVGYFGWSVVSTKNAREAAEAAERDKDRAFRGEALKDIEEAKAEAATKVMTILRMMTEPDGKVSPEVLLKSIGSDAERCVLAHFQLGWKLFLTDGKTISREYKEAVGIHDEYTVDWSNSWARIVNDNQIDFVPPYLYRTDGEGKKSRLAIGENEVVSPPVNVHDKCKISYGLPLERHGLYSGAAIVASDDRGYLIVVGLGSGQPPVR